MPLLSDKSLSRSSVRRAEATNAPLLLGRWELVRTIHEGAWSRVYLARPAGGPLDRPADYVVKAAASDQNRLSVGMIQREAWVGQRVSHAHLVPVLDAHVDQPPFYLVTPYLPGQSLRGWIECDTLSVPFALWIARQTAEALSALHGHGWRHADVKPDNIHVAADGHATLLDLGFAVELSPSQWRHDRPFQGTLSYAAPETLTDSEPIERASDIYSLGAVLYEMLTGRPPFMEPDGDTLAAAILYQPLLPPRHYRPDIPLRVCHFVRQLLARQALRRPTAEEAADQLAVLEIACFDSRP